MSHLLTVAILCGAGLCVRATVPQFTIDLDLPPEKRWRGVANFYRKEIPAMMRSWQKIMDSTMNASMQSEWIKALNISDEYVQEFTGYVNEIGDPDVTVDGLKLMAHMYEINQESAKACSGVLIAMPNGNVIHGRNMDYGLPFEVDGQIKNWPDVTFEAIFVRNKVPLMTSVHWAGGIGVHTAMRFGGWTFEQNTRSETNTLEANLAAAKTGAVGFALVVREVMLNTSDFEVALSALKHLNVMAPQYFIMSGAGAYQGAVISMDRFGHHDASTTPAVVRLSAENDTWHIVQTNDDQFEPPEDIRRPIANFEINNFMARDEVSLTTVKHLMISAPLYNEGTVFTWVAEPATDDHEVYLPASSFGGIDRDIIPGASPASAVQAASDNKIHRRVPKSVSWRRAAGSMFVGISDQADTWVSLSRSAA